MVGRARLRTGRIMTQRAKLLRPSLGHCARVGSDVASPTGHSSSPNRKLHMRAWLRAGRPPFSVHLPLRFESRWIQLGYVIYDICVMFGSTRPIPPGSISRAFCHIVMLSLWDCIPVCDGFQEMRRHNESLPNVSAMQITEACGYAQGFVM
jgi:hypothetical protein